MRRRGGAVAVFGYACTALLLVAASASRLSGQAECDARQILAAGSCAGDEVDSLEASLAARINDYRKQHGLSAIPVSWALSLVANRHVRDLALNVGKLSHDWSNCAMTDPKCMWTAPQKLGTGYAASAFESAYAGDTQDPDRVLAAWREKGNGPHNDVLLNLHMWAQHDWKALGIGIYKGYAVMWVGAEVDAGPVAGAAGVVVPKP